MSDSVKPAAGTARGVYLDAAGSEPLHPAAAEVWEAALARGYADPRRLHGAGRDARALLDNARAVVAEALEVRPDEVTFTSSGTDAVHRGLLGLVLAVPGATTVLSAVEHSSVLHAARWAGGPLVEAPVDALGRVSPDAVASVQPDGPMVVAVQSANHEVFTDGN